MAVILLMPQGSGLYTSKNIFRPIEMFGTPLPFVAEFTQESVFKFKLSLLGIFHLSKLLNFLDLEDSLPPFANLCKLPKQAVAPAPPYIFPTPSQQKYGNLPLIDQAWTLLLWMNIEIFVE